jgi:predicted double-glycine peptidase
VLVSGAVRVFFWTALTVSGALAESGALWLDVPFVKQEKNGCGAASIAMLMRYWAQHGWAEPAREADPRQIQQALYSRTEHGVRGTDVERYIRQNGFRTFVFKGEWPDLDAHLAKGRPLMVCLDWSRRGPSHYVVVAGVDPAAHLVLVNDPARRKLLKMERSEFERAWSAAGNWTLLAVPISAP